MLLTKIFVTLHCLFKKIIMPESNNSRQGRKRQSAPVDITYGHLQPQAIEIEKLVLGALLIDRDAFTVVSEILRPETFYDPRNQKIYHAIQTLNMEQKPCDIMTVTEQLKHEGTFEEVGGAGYIVEISSHVASSANIEYHARILQQKFLARQLIHYASVIETEAMDETVDVDELMQKAEGLLFELSQKNMAHDFTQIDPIIDLANKQLLAAASNKGELTGVPSGFHDLDKITSGWQKSDLIIIAGRPAMGKTSFALSVAKNMAVDYQRPVGFFSLEMSNVQLVNRLISNVCEIPGNKLLSGQLAPDEWERFDKNLRKLTGAPIYIDDTPALSVFELRTKARRLVREHHVQCIMIDYLQLMNANGMRFTSRQEEVSTISRSLKGLAKELDIPIIALSQLNRSVEQRDASKGVDGKRPQLSDLRESGAIEQDADMVIFVHRPEYYKITAGPNNEDLRGKALIIIAKHRKGATDDVLLNFNGAYTHFSNLDDDSFQMPLQDGEGEILGSRMNGDNPLPPSPTDAPF